MEFDFLSAIFLENRDERLPLGRWEERERMNGDGSICNEDMERLITHSNDTAV